MERAIDLLKCPKCGHPLSFEVCETISHHVSANGQYLVRTSAFGRSARIEERLLCKHCGQTFIQGEDWRRDESWNIVLIKQKKQKENHKLPHL